MARLTDYLLTPGDVYGWLTTLHKRDYIGAGLVALVVVLGTVVLSFEGEYFWHLQRHYSTGILTRDLLSRAHWYVSFLFRYF